MSEYVRVPRAPTVEMIAATVDAVFGGAIEDASIIAEVYSAMVEAATAGQEPTDADRDYADMRRMQAALIAKTHECNELRALAAEQPQPVCPHIRSSGVGDHATHWCALNGPPSAPQPEAQPVATLHDDGYWTWKRDDFRRQYETQRAGWRMDVFSAPPPAAPGPSEAQDAARYRWLRAGREGVEFRDGDGKWRADCPGGDDLDQIIDAALRAAAAARGR